MNGKISQKPGPKKHQEKPEKIARFNSLFLLIAVCQR
jgi:hypothetical protein